MNVLRLIASPEGQNGVSCESAHSVLCTASYADGDLRLMEDIARRTWDNGESADESEPSSERAVKA